MLSFVFLHNKGMYKNKTQSAEIALQLKYIGSSNCSNCLCLDSSLPSKDVTISSVIAIQTCAVLKIETQREKSNMKEVK